VHGHAAWLGIPRGAQTPPLLDLAGRGRRGHQGFNAGSGSYLALSPPRIFAIYPSYQILLGVGGGQWGAGNQSNQSHQPTLACWLARVGGVFFAKISRHVCCLAGPARSCGRRGGIAVLVLVPVAQGIY
jgi:hypothetical protein